MRRLRLAVVAMLVAAPACGGGGTASAPRTTSAVEGARLIVITMDDFRFEPSALTAHVGETVTLRFINRGTVRHEAVVGDEAVQRAHAEMMQSMATTTVLPKATAPPVGGAMLDIGALATATRRHPGMNAPNVVSVDAGATGEVTYSLAKKAHLLIGCHEIGHYEQGMVATLDVV